MFEIYTKLYKNKSVFAKVFNKKDNKIYSVKSVLIEGDLQFEE